MATQQLADKENLGFPEKCQNEEPQGGVSILKSSQKANVPSEKKLTKVSGHYTSSVITALFPSSLITK